jgi:hypothetical protein
VTVARWAPLALALLVATPVVAVACGGSGDDDGGTVGGREGRGGESEAPPGSDLEAVTPLVEDLLADYDDVVNEIMADMTVAADDDAELVQRFLALHEPGSDFAQEALDAWEQSGADGMSVRPYDEEHPAMETRLDGDLETVSDEEVTVPVCEVQRQVVFQDDQPTEGVPLLEQAAEVTAVRVDDGWRLGERIIREDVVGCETTEGE